MAQEPRKDLSIQIDVVSTTSRLAFANLCVAGVGDFRIQMSENSYEDLKDAGFFIRDGIDWDGARILNTSLTYKVQDDE